MTSHFGHCRYLLLRVFKVALEPTPAPGTLRVATQSELTIWVFGLDSTVKGRLSKVPRIITPDAEYPGK